LLNRRSDAEFDACMKRVLDSMWYFCIFITWSEMYDKSTRLILINYHL